LTKATTEEKQNETEPMQMRKQARQEIKEIRLRKTALFCGMLKLQEKDNRVLRSIQTKIIESME